jgi:hypothetical protein
VDTPEVTPLFPAPPARLWLASQEWSVHPVEFGHKKLEDAYGTTHYEPELAIYYSADRPAREVFDTIWHEITHALHHAFNIAVKSTSARRNEEALAAAHGHAWTQALLDNPALIEWLDVATNFIKSEQETAAE